MALISPNDFTANPLAERGGIPPKSSPGRRAVGDHVVALCRTHEQQALWVSSDRGVGVVFASSGRIVHAEFRDQVGLPALLGVLRLDSAQCQLCDDEAPERYTLSCSATMVSLLLQRLRQGTPKAQAKAGRTRFAR